MLRSELIQTCSYSIIADAAVKSIGGEFKNRVRATAADRGLKAGSLAAALVKNFARNAGESDWRDLDLAMAGSDMPLLCGFRFIMEHALDRGDVHHNVPVWADANSRIAMPGKVRFAGKAA